MMDAVIYICLIAVLAGFIQGVSGFGAVLLSLPLLALFLDVKVVVPLMALSGFAITVYLLIYLWRHLLWRRIAPLFVGTVIGAPIGVLLLKQLPSQYLLAAIGVMLISYSLYGLLAKPYRRGIRSYWAYFFGFLAGCLGGAFTASGPPVIVYTSLQPWSKEEIKASLQGYFFTSGIVVILFQYMGGLMTNIVLKYFLISLPFIVVGAWVGHFFSGKIAEETYRRFIMILLGVLGTLTVLKSI